MNDPLEQKYYSRQEIARIFSVNPMTIYRLIRRGDIKAIRIGNDYRVSEDELKEYMKRKSALPIKK